jgi:hypothetical protein
MDNPETLPILGTQNTGRRLEKTKGSIKNGQSRDTANIGNTRHRSKNMGKKHNTTQKTKKDERATPKTGVTQVISKGKQFLLQICHM